MVAKPSELGGIPFRTLKDRDLHIRSILNQGVRVLSGQELALAFDLLLLHPDADNKIGTGVKQIEVKCSRQGTHYCFWVVREDDSIDDFSYEKCKSKMERLIEKRRESAYREAIQKQITDYRFLDRKSNQSCDHPGCTSSEKIQVDHQHPSFKELVSAFEKDQNNIPTEFDEALGTIYSKRFRESDSAYREAWQEYHKKHATLRLLCKTHNLTRKRKENDS
ncbi:DCL family protein [Anabaena sphaerica FACHB-251]|uniref:DCL family protein n=1 Tax=Anabaena sphaerica FACHB-251 TaxID=2692883 RepID=A0A926WHG4_9NOST|nr:DCL family protein [Anabaena sphaerica]MBD2294630.1 DCL family protein [Anabaena sphaerica FACHB-251]